MEVPCTWPTAVAAIGPTAVGSLAWDDRGELHLTVFVKARFALRHNSPMLITTAPPLEERDVHAEGNPTRSLVRASDLVPYRPMADIWLTGHACAPGGRAVAVTVVRLALHRAGAAVLDKVVHVVGDRDGAASPRPFAQMPLTYERAYGGIGFDDNPVGVGADERPLLPNLVHPEDPERTTGFGPVSRYWKVRRSALSNHDRRLLEQASPSVPRGFDWAYFQAAPVDQRVPFLHGDEWLALDGLHPTMVRIQSRLPKAVGVARIMSITSDDDRGDAVAMVADTLAIDADDQTCSITWRGNVPIASREQLDEVLVAGGVELAGQAVDWQKAREHAVIARRSSVPERPRLDGGVTMVSDDLAVTSIDHPSEPTLPALEVSDLDASSSTYERLEVDSGEWSGDQWPVFPLAGMDDEVTETKTRAEVHRYVGEERPTEVERAPIPMSVDTEPGAPPDVVEDELPWVTEIAVEPEPPEDTKVMRRPPRPPAPKRPLPAKHVSDTRARAASLPPAPLDVSAYEASLRRAGASEEDIAKLLEGLREGSGGPITD